MNTAEAASPGIISSIFIVLGGLALFLLGMKIMTEGLRLAAGDRIRQILALATKSRLGGYGLGTILGFLMHSSAAGVMTVGFINAGLLTLVGAIPILYGLNLGTTLSMQLISFRLTDLAYVFLAAGFFVQMALPDSWMRQAARALMGFGLLFLGMDMMSGALHPFRDDLSPLLTRIDGTTLAGMITGILVAAAITGIIQSSGAIIGMTFVMIGAGIFDSLGQVYPIILGAHIGTSVTSLLASIGTHIEARRAAVANLLFNLFNVGLGALAAVPIIRMIEWWTDDVVHQAAHAHTVVMLLAGVLLLPVVACHARVVRKLVPSADPIPEASHLDPGLLARPEAALHAVMREINRSLGVCQENLRHARDLQKAPDRRLWKRVRLNEEVLNELKGAARDYLTQMTRRYLSRRQALMVQYLSRAASNIERIGDHLESIALLALERGKHNGKQLPEDAREKLNRLTEHADEILGSLRRGLHPEQNDFTGAANRLLSLRDRFAEEAEEVEAWFNRRVADAEEDPLTGLYFSETILALSRLVRHAKVIALEMKQPYFTLKESKLSRVEPAGVLKKEGKPKSKTGDSAQLRG